MADPQSDSESSRASSEPPRAGPGSPPPAELDDETLGKVLPLLEKKFHVLANGCTEAILIWRSDRFDLLYVSPGFERIWGISRQDLLKDPHGWVDALHPDDRVRMQAAVARIHDEDLDEEYRIVRPDGEIRWVHDRALPTRDENGKIIQLAGIAVDITELKFTERQMKRQQSVLLDLAINRAHKYSDINVALGDIAKAAAHCLEVQRVSIWMFNEDKSVLACTELYDKSENVHRAGTELRAEDYPRYFNALLTERSIAAHDAHTDPRTSEFSAAYLGPLDIHAMLDAPIRIGGDLRGVVCHEQVGAPRHWLASDQSFAASAADLVSLTLTEHERHREEQERLELESKFAQTQKMESLGILAGGIAHDFNNLLQGMLGNVELARLALSADSPAQERLKAVGDTARRASELCDELLAYSGQGEVMFTHVDLAKTMREMAHLMETAISKTCEMRFEFEPDLPLIYADHTQVRQVILNLITNASEAIGTNPGTVILRARVKECQASELETAFHHDPLPAGRYVVLDIEDTGCGMDEKTLPRIFEPFYTTRFTGRGLGLSATLGIMRAHRAALDVRSTLGVGTRFRLSFPALPDGATLEPEATQQKPAPHSGGTILVVDDEAMVLHAAQAMLQDAGYEVVLAENGDIAIRIVRERGAELDCVLLDLLMPGTSGEKVFLELRDIRADLPVIISSGYSHKKMSSFFPDGEVARFIKKPYDLDQLLRAVGEAVSSS